MVTNINVDEVMAQKAAKDEEARLAAEARAARENKKTFEFNENNYLDTRVEKGQQKKELTIRLLPFSPTDTSPFKKIKIHSIYTRWEDGKKQWKKFMCPAGNGEEGKKCPFCEMSAKARQWKFEADDEAKKKEFGDIEFMYKVKDYWLVRCIDREHPEHGPKFWRFPDAKNGKGVWDEIISLFQSRQKRGTNIFDLYKGKDLIISIEINKDASGKEKVVYHIQDDDKLTPLSESEEQMEEWVNDEKGLDDVYPVKDYNYLAIIAQGDYPVWSKTLNQFIGKFEAEKIQMEAREQERQENLIDNTTDFSSFAEKDHDTPTEKKIKEEAPAMQEPAPADEPEDDLPF